MSDSRRNGDASAADRRLADAKILIRVAGASLAADDRLTLVRAIHDRAATFAADGRLADASAEYARITEQFDGVVEEELRWHVARAVVARTRILRDLGDDAGAETVLRTGEERLEDYLWPSERAIFEQVEAGLRCLDAKRVERALEHFEHAMGAWRPEDAPPPAIEAARLHAQAAFTAGRGVEVALRECDEWLAAADDAVAGERRAAFGWLYAGRAWIQDTAGHRRPATASIAAGLAYAGDDSGGDVAELREYLLDERARRSEHDGPPVRPPARHLDEPIPPHVLPRMAPQHEARLLARRWSRDRTVAARRERLRVILRHRGDLPAEDQHLLAFCAYRRALRLERRDDYLVVKRRLADLGRDRQPPAPIRSLMDRLHVSPGDGPAFAEALLPHAMSWTGSTGWAGTTYGGGD